MSLLDFQDLFFDSLKGPLASFLDIKHEAYTSMLLEANPIQDPFRFRARFLGLRISSVLMDDEGELIESRLRNLNQLLEEGAFLIGPRRESDALLYGHVKRCINLLLNDPVIWKTIHRFSVPLCHKKAEEVIRETLLPQQVGVVETKHVRKAVLCAWLTSLRQSTGSCFATAPAILIQQESPLRFFRDLHELLDLGQMKRIVAGKELSVPFSLNPGVGDLLRKAPYLENSLGINVSLKGAGVHMTPEVQELIRSMEEETPQKVLRSVLLDFLELTEEDLVDEANLARMRLTPLLISHSPVFYQEPTERAKKVSEWKKLFKRACTTFRTITECSLLRTWEYSLASFADLKVEFTRWNLYIGLGIHPDEKGGVGEFLYAQVNNELQECNKQIEAIAREFNESQATSQALEVMLQGATSETRRHQIKSELMSHSLNLESLVKTRDAFIAKAEGLSGFFASLIEQYDQKMQEYFQELFDPSMIDEDAEVIDDSAAGFRLVYKHGRMDASQWTPIYTQEQYIDTLREFFSSIETDIECPNGVEREFLTRLTTKLIQFIQEPEFLLSSFERVKAKGRRSPWDYISGGTLQMLVSSYLNRVKPFSELKITPRSPEELLNFLQGFEGGHPLLMHSPTHAFIFYPDRMHSSTFTPENGPWNELKQEYLAHRLSERLPDDERALFLHRFRQIDAAKKNRQVRANLIHAISERIKGKEMIVDGMLFEQTPLFTRDEAKEAVAQILYSFGMGSSEIDLEGTFFGAWDLFQIVKMAILKTLKEAFSKDDWDARIAENMRKFKLLSSPIFFADTNWSGWFFGFTRNPGTRELELWRFNRIGTQGFPMIDWKQWMSSKNSAPWIVLKNPKEYSFDF